MLRKLAQKIPQFPLSSWIILGTALILGIIIATLATWNINKQENYTAKILSEKGAALIKSFEAGARTGVRGKLGPQAKLQSLLEETAAQEDINFLTVTDKNGSILAHNNEQKVDEQFLTAGKISSLEPEKNIKWQYFSEQEPHPTFMVYREFTPFSLDVLSKRHSNAAANKGGQSSCVCPQCEITQEMCKSFFGSSNFPQKTYYIFVGLDATPYLQAQQIDKRHTVFISGILLLLGSAGVSTMFWAQRVRTTSRLLQDEQALSSVVLTSIPLGLMVFNREMKTIYTNEQARRLTGVSTKQAPEQAYSLLPENILRIFSELSASNSVLEREVQCSFNQDSTLPLSISAAKATTQDGSVVGYVLILRNLSQIKELESRIKRQEKLAAIGNLAAGIAHEIRNPLSSIKGYATYFQQKSHSGGTDEEAARIMVQEVERLNRVVSELLEFSKPTRLQKKETDLNDLIQKSLKYIHNDMSQKNIQVDFIPDPKIPYMYMDKDRFNQVLLNLYINALQAMDYGGRLSISLEQKENNFVCIHVADTGKGIHPDEQEKIFNPYFSTKKSGTGLGLAVAYKLIEAHEGFMQVNSQVGMGTTFSICIPGGLEDGR